MALRLKKTAHAEEQRRPDVLEQRRDWLASQLDLDPAKLVFVDETGASTSLARTHGRCRRGRRLPARPALSTAGSPRHFSLSKSCYVRSLGRDNAVIRRMCNYGGFAA